MNYSKVLPCKTIQTNHQSPNYQSPNQRKMSTVKYTQPQIKRMNTVAIILSIAVPLLVAILMNPRMPKMTLPFDPYILPPFYATINAVTAVVLILAVYFIKQRKIDLHQRMIYIAMGLSAIFLISYVLYHSSTQPTSYGGEGAIRYVYYFLLISHIILSAVVVPFVLFTFIRGFTRQDARHKKIAKWTFPLWLYVAVTGVVCYLMISPYYG